MMPMRDNHARSDIDMLSRRVEAMNHDLMRMVRELNVLNDKLAYLTRRVDALSYNQLDEDAQRQADLDEVYGPEDADNFAGSRDEAEYEDY